VSGYTLRYEGTRWKVYYGDYDAVGRFAVNELQKIVQRFMPYVVEVCPATGDIPDPEAHAVLVGTPSDNPLIAKLVDLSVLAAPTAAEEYSIASLDSPWSEGRRLLVIAGADPNGVLYGAYDLDIRILSKLPITIDQMSLRKAFDEMADFSLREAPAIRNRGIWTWGYVIYDYRRFIDNMACCKMNMLTIWNDHPPLNMKEVIEYAHTHGIRVVLGYHWGWGTPVDPNSDESLESVKAEVVWKHREYYSDLGIDGVYFQLGFTESNITEIGGKSVGALCCRWVNEISRAMLAENPVLHIQCGLHASSIMDSYVDLEDLDPRVTLVWEDAGTLPYSYTPVESYPEESFAQRKELGSVDATLEYSKKLASLRGGKEFGMVPKGWTTLDWGGEFEHHGRFILGERDADYVRQRLAIRQPQWDYHNALWFKLYPHAARFYREMVKCVDGPITATGVIEDGVFEEAIQPSAALFAETLWNPSRSDNELLVCALSTHYTRRYSR
jgi:hypothetical protein